MHPTNANRRLHRARSADRGYCVRIEVSLAAACVLLGSAGDTRVSRDCTGPSGPADSSYHVTVSTVQAPCSIEFARQDGRFYTLLELEDGTYSAAVGDFSLAPVR